MYKSTAVRASWLLRSNTGVLARWQAREASQYIFDLGGGCVVDAMRMGNQTRRMNHSEQPNVGGMVVNHRGVRKVCIRAKVDIPKGNELTFNYGTQFRTQLFS